LAHEKLISGVVSNSETVGLRCLYCSSNSELGQIDAMTVVSPSVNLQLLPNSARIFVYKYATCVYVRVLF